MKKENEFKFELQDYLTGLIDETLQKKLQFKSLAVSTLDQLQRKQYENELRHIEKHLFDLTLLYKMTVER